MPMPMPMPMPFFFFFFFFFFFSSASSFPYDISLYIDCGSPTNSTDPFRNLWLSDRYFTGGSTSVVSEPLHFRFPQEKTLRFFPLSSGKKNCYIVPLPSGRYYVRTFTVYDNYDGKSHSPSFDASVEGTLVFSWRSPWPENLARDGAYSDLFAFVKDGEADICFYSIATDPPVIGSLEIRQIDPLSYNSPTIGDDFILVNYGRLSCGSVQWGPGFSNDTDYFGRSWQSDSDFRSPTTSNAFHSVSTREKISGTDQLPNYFPMKLYQSAVTGSGVLEYKITVDAKLDYLLWFHFAEIDPGVTRNGQRVFDVLINGKNVSRVDIHAKVGSFAAYILSYTAKNLSSTELIVKLVPVVGAPLISGIENYALIPNDISTAPEQVVAMRSLKESLRIPDRMGWNGDPCAPTNWDAWEGVTCHSNTNGTALVISQIDLGSQGLKGYISDQISLLSNLVSLNLSSNSLGGTLPTGLGHKSLLRIDLSNNQFSGPIPQSLASSSLQFVRLNDNLLEGRVQEELYSLFQFVIHKFSLVKVWSTNQKASVLNIDMKANIYCVKYNPGSSNYIAVWLVDHHIHYYDLRNISQPLHLFSGHRKAFSYMKFLSNGVLASASTDSTLRPWDVKENLPERAKKCCKLEKSQGLSYLWSN